MSSWRTAFSFSQRLHFWRNLFVFCWAFVVLFSFGWWMLVQVRFFSVLMKCWNLHLLRKVICWAGGARTEVLGWRKNTLRIPPFIVHEAPPKHMLMKEGLLRFMDKGPEPSPEEPQERQPNFMCKVLGTGVCSPNSWWESQRKQSQYVKKKKKVHVALSKLQIGRCTFTTENPYCCLVVKPRPTPCDSMGCSPPGTCSWGFQGKNTGMGCHFFTTQGASSRLLHWQLDSLPLSHQGSPQWTLGWKYPLYNRTGIAILQ